MPDVRDEVLLFQTSDFGFLSAFGIRVSDFLFPLALQLAVRGFPALIRSCMSIACQIVVCGSIVPDPLQTREVASLNVIIPTFDNIS